MSVCMGRGGDQSTLTAQCFIDKSGHFVSVEIFKLFRPFLKKKHFLPKHHSYKKKKKKIEESTCYFISLTV